MSSVTLLDIFGQNPRLSGLYTQLCFCFSLPDSDAASTKQAINLLEKGLERLCFHFPWIAGQVVRSDTGEYSIEHNDKPLRLVTKDGIDALPTMATFLHARFPFSMLDEATVAIRKTLPITSDKPPPVFLVKATIIHGGLLLNFDAQHNCMDMAGQCQIIRLFSKACRNEAFTAEEIHVGNQPRHEIIPQGDDVRAPISSTPSRPIQSVNETRHNPTPASITDSIWAYFLFSATALAELKSFAEETKNVPFVSTDDALSALVWQCVTRARLPDLDTADAGSDSTFDRQVDARKALGISAGYPGNVVHKASAVMTVKAVVEASLGALASTLRSSLGDSEVIAKSTRESAAKLRQTLQHSSSDLTTAGGNSRQTGLHATDIRMSSWAKEDCYDFDFGWPLNKATAIRRPKFPAWEGLGYFMPKTLDGEIAVALCLKAETMERLKGDAELLRFSSFVG